MHSVEIKDISYEEIFPVWSEHLWIYRDSKIESYSLVTFNKYPFEYVDHHKCNNVSFTGAFINDKLVGVNSGHVIDNSYRSRGLYVFPEYRRNGIGTFLLKETLSNFRKTGLEYCWSIPRSSSMDPYLNAGFRQVSDWFSTEMGTMNCFVLFKP